MIHHESASVFVMLSFDPLLALPVYTQQNRSLGNLGGAPRTQGDRQVYLLKGMMEIYKQIKNKLKLGGVVHFTLEFDGWLLYLGNIFRHPRFQH